MRLTLGLTCKCNCMSSWIALQEPSLITVKAVLILDNDGKRIIAKVILRNVLLHNSFNAHPCMQYYDDTFPTLKDQTKFEESLFNKTRRSNGKLHDGIIVYVNCVPYSLCFVIVFPSSQLLLLKMRS